MRWCSPKPIVNQQVSGRRFDGTRDLSSVECYDPVRNMWSLLPGLGSRRSCLGVASLRGLVYVAGGYDGASCLSSVEQFDPLVGSWTSVAGMEYRRRYCRLSVLGERLSRTQSVCLSLYITTALSLMKVFMCVLQ